MPEQFATALSKKLPRPIVFGPIEFTDLSQADGFDEEKAREGIINVMEKTMDLGEKATEVCIHGYQVMVKERTLKRRTSILKHSRFLANMEVRPTYPPEPEQAADDHEEREEEQEESD